MHAQNNLLNVMNVLSIDDQANVVYASIYCVSISLPTKVLYKHQYKGVASQRQFSVEEIHLIFTTTYFLAKTCSFRLLL